MWIVELALRRPVSTIAMAALMMLFGLYSFFAMPKDIFPAVNLPEINLVWYYPGMSAPEIEQRIVNITERAASQTINGIDHIESNSFTGIGVIKIYFQESASTALAISQLDAVTNAIRNILPQGIAPPTMLDFDATNVPITDIVSTSETLSTPTCTITCSTSSGSFCLPARLAEPRAVRRRDAADHAQSGP